MKKVFSLFYFLLFFHQFSFSQKIQSKEQSPKLVVGIVVDQMRYDYLYRYWDKYGEDGFKKLVTNGFNCKNANFNYMPTFTGPGHASIYTGTTPAVHGIIANDWYDRKTGKKIYCTEDKTVQTVGSTSDAGLMSPRNMLSTSVGDELRISTNFKSKVIGISLKDRGAILPAGHSANAAYWFDALTGHWITSSHYMKELPQWVTEFNKKELVSKYLSSPWKTLLPIEQYTESLADDNAYEGLFAGETKPVFPHNLPEISKQEGMGLIRNTPFGNSFTKDFAIESIKAENLGKGLNTDFIAISFSSPDYIGHKFGPQSIEIEDNYLRLDKDLAELISFLEKHVSKENLLLFLTADHGGANVPDYMNDNKIPAGYFSSEEKVQQLKNHLEKIYGKGEYILNYSNEQLFLNRNLIAERNIDLLQIQNTAAEFMLKFQGISNAFTASALSGPVFKGVGGLLQNGYSQKRSGDVLLVLEPGWMEYHKTGTTHGTVYSYDTHVPLLWYGWKINKGSSTEPVFINDIAPTISSLLNISFPNGCTGQPIQAIMFPR